MIHARRVIRQAVVALLAAADTLAEDRVFDHPNNPRMEFPALVVLDDGEQQRATTLPAGADRTVERRYTFIVRAEVQQTDDYAETRDDLMAEVEAVLAVARAVPGVKAISPVGYDVSESTGHERPVFVGIQRFEALYYTPQGDPSTTL